MSAGTQAKTAHDDATRKLEVAAQIKQATVMLTGLSAQKDAIDGKFQETASALAQIRNRPEMPTPSVTAGTGAADFAAQMDKAATAELEASKVEETLAAELETLGDAKDALDAQHAALLEKIGELRSAFAGGGADLK